MCLEKKKYNIYKIADKDLYTLKFLKKGLKAPYREFFYKLNKKYSIFTSPWWGYFSDEISRGFYSIKGDYYADQDVMVICKIPKGSKYHLGTNGDVVSNRIKLVEIINEEKTQYYKGYRELLINGMKHIYEKYPDNNLITDEYIKYEIKQKTNKYEQSTTQTSHT